MGNEKRKKKPEDRNSQTKNNDSYLLPLGF